MEKIEAELFIFQVQINEKNLTRCLCFQRMVPL